MIKINKIKWGILYEEKMKLTITTISSESPLLKWVFKLLSWDLGFVSSHSSTSLHIYFPPNQNPITIHEQNLGKFKNIKRKTNISIHITSDQSLLGASELQPIKNQKSNSIRRRNKYFNLLTFSYTNANWRRQCTNMQYCIRIRVLEGKRDSGSLIGLRISSKINRNLSDNTGFRRSLHKQSHSNKLKCR